MKSADELRCGAHQLREALPPRHEVIGLEDTGQRLTTLHRSVVEELRVSWCECEGHPFLNLQIWNRRRTGWWPDVKCRITIRIDELADVADAVAAALDLAVEAQSSRPAPAPSKPGRLPPPASSRQAWSTTLPTPEPPADEKVFGEFLE